MTALEKIEAFLCQNAGKAYCDDCLSSALSIRPRQQVQQKTAQLASDNKYWRSSDTCVRCREVRVVIRQRIVISQ
jgi:hypothetical protein